MLKVDRSHRDLVLGWFKDDLTKLEENASQISEVGLNPTRRKPTIKNQDYDDDYQPKQQKKSVADVIDEKMQNQIKKSKIVGNNRSIVSHERIIKTIDMDNIEEDSKVALVSKKENSKVKAEKDDDSTLNSANCNKAALKNKRNKLRKQIKKLEIKLSHDSTPSLMEKMSRLQQQLVESAPVIQNPSCTRKYPKNQPFQYVTDYHDEFYKMEKKRKIRSRQKNIRKDNRPDHMKPPHLRKIQYADTSK